VTDSFASPVLYEYVNERELLNKKQNIKLTSLFFDTFILEIPTDIIWIILLLGLAVLS
jgi:hypothetical protein